MIRKPEAMSSLVSSIVGVCYLYEHAVLLKATVTQWQLLTTNRSQNIVIGGQRGAMMNVDGQCESPAANEHH